MIVASIDIGTNTVILLIAKVDLNTLKITPLINETRMPRIGQGVKKSGFISVEKSELLYSVLMDYDTIIKANKCDSIIVTGTNAFRIASNTTSIIKEIKHKFNYDLTVITGEKEAEYAYWGAISDFTHYSSTLVIDIGGSSTEIIYGNSNQILSKVSLQLGSVAANEQYLKHSPPLQKELQKLESEINQQISRISLLEKPDHVIAVAGTATTIACMFIGLKEFKEVKVNKFEIKFDMIKSLITKLEKISSTQILELYGPVMTGREDIILAGSYILYYIMRELNIREIIISTRGIRYGAILEYIKRVK